MVNGEGGERGGWPMGRVTNGRVAKGGVANGRVAIGRVAKVATPIKGSEYSCNWANVKISVKIFQGPTNRPTWLLATPRSSDFGA